MRGLAAQAAPVLWAEGVQEGVAIGVIDSLRASFAAAGAYWRERRERRHYLLAVLAP